MRYDTVIIGAGLSGLAAGIRLAYFDRSVCLLERHTTIGGLNSFYRLRDRNHDVGLHAVTNYAAPGTLTGPLSKLLRQLRLRWDDFALVPRRAKEMARDAESMPRSPTCPIPPIRIPGRPSDARRSRSHQLIDLVGHDHTVIHRTQPTRHDDPHTAGMEQSFDLIGQTLAHLQSLKLGPKTRSLEMTRVVLERSRSRRLDVLD